MSTLLRARLGLRGNMSANVDKIHRFVLIANNRDLQLGARYNPQNLVHGGETPTNNLALVILVNIYPRLASALALLR